MYEPEPGPERDALAVINEIPRAFFRLSAVAETVFGELGISAPERGVMRDLFIEGEATAPDLAQRKPVTRQSIQPVLDSLVAKGFVRTRENPRHKRSRLYALTQSGIEHCVEVQKRELVAIREMIAEMNAVDFAAAAAVLQAMNERLAEKIGEPR